MTKYKVITAIVVGVIGLKICIFLLLTLLLALNGYSEADGAPVIYVFLGGSLLTLCGGMLLGYAVVGRFMKPGRKPWFAVLLTAMPVLFLIAAAEVVLLIGSVVVADSLRPARVVRPTTPG